MTKPQGSEPAFARPASQFTAGPIDNMSQTGLTKRELFAAMAMQSIGVVQHSVDEDASLAVQMADALIRALGASDGK